MKFIYSLIIALLGLTMTPTLFAKEKRPKAEYYSLPAQDQYHEILNAFQNNDWVRLIEDCKILLATNPSTPFTSAAKYYLGVGYFNRRDFDLADKPFSIYLKEETSPKYFEDAIQYKFRIAEHYGNGARKHIFGVKGMPKWVIAYDDAVKIYDEVITTLPRHDLAAQSLYQKGKLLLSFEDYKESIDAYQTLIRRFPKHSLAPDCYLGIAQVYERRCQKEFADPTLLDLAEINLRKFHKHFPGESRIKAAEHVVQQIKERLAKELYEIGEFYKRTKKPDAAAIYYTNIIDKYPGTSYATKSRKRLKTLSFTFKSASEPVKKDETPAIIADSSDD